MTEAAPKRKGWRAWIRGLVWTVLLGSFVLGAAAALLLYWSSTPGFESWVRKRLVERIEQATGGRVEVGSFHWRPLNLEAEAGGVVIHGLEAPGEAPYAQVDRVRVGLSILNFWSPKILLRNLEVVHPGFHFIVYPDGSTNQPQPRAQQTGGKSAIDTIFDLEAGRIAVEQGVLDYEDRAIDIDERGRPIQFEFSASDVSLHLSYVSAVRGAPERYLIEAGARDWRVADIRPAEKPSQVEGYAQATIELTRNTLTARSLRITSRRTGAEGTKEHALEVSGTFENFAHPRWRGRAAGELDLRLIDAAIGYPDVQDGIARVDLAGAGQGSQFRIDGQVHAEGAAYIGNGVTVSGVGLDCRVHADPEQLVTTATVIRLKDGGRLEGSMTIGPWLEPLPGATTIERGGQNGMRATPGTARAGDANGSNPRVRVYVKPPDIPMNGKVDATLKDLRLDTVLDIVGQPPLMRVGMDTQLNGPMHATWANGANESIVIGGTLSLSPGNRPEPGEVEASGTLDATYTHRDGAVAVRRLELRTPGGELDAHGEMGVFPETGPTSLSVDLRSNQLRDYDTFLRDIGLERNGKTGIAALPVSLAGQAEFHGNWTGSLVDPHISGSAQATQLSIQTAPISSAGNPQPRWVHWDSIEAVGTYSADKIEVSRGALARGNTRIALNGTLLAAQSRPVGPRHARVPEFDDDSTLHLRIQARSVGPEQLLPLVGHELPLTGAIDTDLSLDGPIRTLSGSGWAQLNGGIIYSSAVEKLRVQGSLAGERVTLSSVTAQIPAGTVLASGEVNFESNQFKLDSHGSKLDVAKIADLSPYGLVAAGKADFTLSGSGTFDDPLLNGQAAFTGLTLNGVAMGPLQVTAHTANHAATYEASTHVDAANVQMHGRTALASPYATQAQLDFTQFNIGPLLAMANLQSLGGDSALEGAVTLDGPLAHIDQLRGEARFKQLAVTVAGVHLKSDSGLHASLANALVSLDPLHITGEQTDLRAQGTLSLKDTQQLDFATSGAINLKLGEMLDPDLTASGTTTFQVDAHGPLKKPVLRGRIDFQDGSLALGDVPNGLSKIHGTLEFNQDSLEVKSLTAVSGGGLLSVGGYLAYQHGLYADLSVTGKGIRIRYPEGVSSLADATFHLQGAQNSLLLSGDVLVTRFSVSPDLDVVGLAAQANSASPVVSLDAPSNHIRLDVHITSSPQLNFQNTVAKLAGNVDLRLRGTLASPTLLGSVQITEGNALIAGTRYELQRGSVAFTNPVRIEPSIDLSATAHVSDYDITLGLHGTPSKLSVTYRSDPPLPEADVVALLALGRTGDQQRLYTQQQEQQGTGSASDLLLGGALNATVSSRVQKLFGAGSVKVDPNYLGALGNSTSRIIVEEQVGKYMTLTYATNVNTTQQQLLQAEIAINRHVSLLVARDESGVFSMVVKATRRFR